MTPWVAILIASFAVYSWKIFGYLLPSRFLESKLLRKTAGYITVALLSALVGVQTFITGQNIVFDARLVAILAAAFLLKLRIPFIGVVIIAAAIAALFRLAF